MRDRHLAVVAVLAVALHLSAAATTGMPISGSLQAEAIVVRDSTSLRGFGIKSAHVTAAGTASKHITSVVYSIKAYPPSPPAVESVEICYSTPYSSIIGNCTPVAVGSSGVITAFNSLTFGAGSVIWIRHRANGAPLYSPPPSADTLTVNWAY